MTQQKTVVVTGASRGIGLACVEAFLARNCRVVMVARGAETLTAAAQGLQSDRVWPVALDVSDPDAPRRIREAIPRHWGEVSILVNNSGKPTVRRGGQMVGFLDLTDDDWSSVMDVNLHAVFRMSREFLPGMVHAHWGRVINIGSGAGRGRAISSGASYSVSKAGLLGLTRAIASEFAAHGITANTVAPGLIETEMMRARPAELNAAHTQKIPVGRMGTPREIAAIVAFLAGDDAGFINGAIIDANGGSFMP